MLRMSVGVPGRTVCVEINGLIRDQGIDIEELDVTSLGAPCVRNGHDSGQGLTYAARRFHLH